MRSRKELLLNPVTIRRTKHEVCHIEPSINSVRVSFRLKQEDADPIEEILCRKFLRFLMQRAEDYVVMRRIPIEGYSISFLVTNRHLEEYSKKRILDFIMHFVQEADKEISEMKLSISSRGRVVASEFMQAF